MNRFCRAAVSGVMVALIAGAGSAQQTADPLKAAQDKARQEAEAARREALKKLQAAEAEAKKAAQDAMGHPAGGAMSPEQMKAMMDEWAKLNAPAAEHTELAAMVGEWDAEVSAWMDPSMPAMTSTGKMVSEAIFGGRFIKQTYKGAWMGQEFEGLGYTGFNRATGKFESSWMDSMGTALYFMTGDMSEGGKIMTFYGSETDPMTKQTKKLKDVIVWADKNNHVMTRFYVEPDGKETRGMEIKFTRTGTPKPTGAATPKADVNTTRPASGK